LTIKDKLSPLDVKVYSLKEAKDNYIDITYFHCEKDEFNDHFLTVLPTDDSNGLGKAFLFTYNEKVIGYLVLAMSQLNRTWDKKFNRSIKTVEYIPALLIGKMARHDDYKGRGIGIMMRDYALNKALKLSEQIGCRLLALSAVEDKIELYHDWGFSPIDIEYRHIMFIDILTLKNTKT
jgi:GNAT superfamily N-acetyltransferase